MKTNRIRTLAIAFGLFLLVGGVVAAFTVGNVDGVWGTIDTNGASCDRWATGPAGGSMDYDFPTAISNTNTGVQTGLTTDWNQVRYGNYDRRYCDSSDTPTQGHFAAQSGFGFDGNNGSVTPEADTAFLLGTFAHFNNPIQTDGTAFSWVDLAITVPVNCDDDETPDTNFTFTPRFTLDETPNQAPCAYAGSTICPDKVTVSQEIAQASFTCADGTYTVNVLGFVPDADGICPATPAGAYSTEFVTEEGADNVACLYAQISKPTADVTVAKDCLAYGSQNQNYRMAVTNLGPGSAREVTLTDTFPDGVVVDSYTSYLITTDNGAVSQGACSFDGQDMTCNLNTLLPSLTADLNAKWVVNVYFDGGPGLPNPLNTATVDADNDTNTGNNSDDAVCLISSAVDLISFTATGGESSVAVAWETASETDNAWFNLYRAESESGDKVKVNGEIIPAANPGSTMGATYGYTDSAVAQGVTYYYWLEDVDTAGVATMHGPVSASLIAAEAPAGEAPAGEAPAGEAPVGEEQPEAVQPVFERPIRELPVIGLPGLERPSLPQPIVIGPVDQMPLIVTPGNPPVVAPAPVMPAPIVRPPRTGLPVEGGME